jgi:hypothetical protein
MSWIAAVVLALGAVPEISSQATQPVPEFRVHLGGQVGFPFLVGAHSLATFFKGGRPQLDVDATWEPSVQLQSYSVGTAYHLLGSGFFVGGRVRLIQDQAPWARGPVTLFFGLGAEVGFRFRVGERDKGLITILGHGTLVPGQATNLKSVFGLSLGFSWSVFERSAG